jgi:hypothetical protein
MRRLLVALVCVGLLVGVLAAAVEARDAQRRPALRLVDSAPLTIRGSEFVRGERVRIEVRVGGHVEARAARAGMAGVFVVSFPGATFDRCSDLFVSAVGATGTRATLKLPRPHCPVPLTAP